MRQYDVAFAGQPMSTSYDTVIPSCPVANSLEHQAPGILWRNSAEGPELFSRLG